MPGTLVFYELSIGRGVPDWTVGAEHHTSAAYSKTAIRRHRRFDAEHAECVSYHINLCEHPCDLPGRQVFGVWFALRLANRVYCCAKGKHFEVS